MKLSIEARNQLEATEEDRRNVHRPRWLPPRGARPRGAPPPGFRRLRALSRRAPPPWTSRRPRGTRPASAEPTWPFPRSPSTRDATLDQIISFLAYATLASHVALRV